MGAFEEKLLRQSVDLVIPHSKFLEQIEQTAPETPQLVYTNVSNIYENLLTDWLNYADDHAASREEAFYHVNRATPFTGDSASSIPVNRFWNIDVSSDGRWIDRTSASRPGEESYPLGRLGESVVIGYTERYREINIALKQAAKGGWAAQLEYVSAVDAAGNPTEWKPIDMIKDGTIGLTRSGRMTFDPPADWKPASLNGSARLYYVRLRTVAGGSTPVVNSILGRDYVNAHGTRTGIIPAFDANADANHDGYLNDAEYAGRVAGKDARFEYEARLFYPAYGQQRFATNPGSDDFRRWAADFAKRSLEAQPLADGLFLDNSNGKLPVDAAGLNESVANYAQEYGELLGEVNRAIAPKWGLANSAGGRDAVDPIVSEGVSYLEEFALRPMSHNYVQFEDTAGMIGKRTQESAGRGYAILDSYPVGGSPTDPRTQMATLAYYYLVADPESTFLMFNGGFEPGTGWTRHWSEAVEFNVGQPKEGWSVFASGADPSNGALTYKVYQREYDNALVLYKPLSYANGVSGSTANNTGTVHQLGGTYRVLQANGKLGPTVTSIRLRNGEGAVLVKV
jgi:hypothetical protein